MKKGQKNPHTKKWNKKISEGVKRQWAEGRGNASGLRSKEALEKAWKTTWKGEKVSYVGLHRWVVYWKGRPKLCEECGRTDKNKYEWVNINHKYRRILSDYIRMCTSCHRKYDIKYNNTPPNQYTKI